MTATGNLVRFDLNNTDRRCSVVFSGQQVVAAQALSTGQVVVALANGAVDLLDYARRRPDRLGAIAGPGGNPRLAQLDRRAQERQRESSMCW